MYQNEKQECSEEHREHQREEQVLHDEHKREEELLHQAHMKEEETLHRQHEEEERDVHIEVAYNGVTKPLEVNLDTPTKTALDAAIRLFGITQNAHLLSLYKKAGTELSDAQSLEEQGIKKCDLLLLRPSTVKGG